MNLLDLIKLISFTNPLALIGLLSLPAVWFVIKLTPPRARTISFSSLFIIEKLKSSKKSSQKTPIWLLLLRMLIILILVLTLSDPYINLSKTFKSNSNTIIIVDDGWSSASNWGSYQKNAKNIIKEIKNNNKGVYIISSTLVNKKQPNLSLMSYKEANVFIDNLQPNPWQIDRAELIKAINKKNLNENLNVFWIRSNLNKSKVLTEEYFYNFLIKKYKNIEIISPENNIKIINKPTLKYDSIIISLTRFKNDIVDEKSSIRITGLNNKIIYEKELTFLNKSLQTEEEIFLPIEILSQISKVNIKNESNAAATYLFDDKWRKKRISIISDDNNYDSKPLLSSIYYLKKALSPYGKILISDIENSINLNSSIIVMPDRGKIDPILKNKLLKWVKKGGLLIRFAGPRLANSKTDLLPIKIDAKESRYMGGALTWESPLTFAEFDKNSIFYGIKIPQEVKIKRQVIANSSYSSEKLIWARLEDGTPIVSSSKDEKGWLVLFHTTANNEWSNLPISQLFLSMMNRLTMLGKGYDERLYTEKLPLKMYLNGYGGITKPTYKANIAINQHDQLYYPSYSMPPGIYGNTSIAIALNLAGTIEGSDKNNSFLGSEILSKKNYVPDTINLKNFLLYSLILLFLLDTLIAFILKSKMINIFNLKFNLKKKYNLFILTFFVILFNSNYLEAETYKYINNTSLAYINTGDLETDNISHLGLLSLSKKLSKRTSIEPSYIVGVNINYDEIYPFPFLYWPVINNQIVLKKNTVFKIKHYLRNGGIILFDTQDNFNYDNSLVKKSNIRAQNLRDTISQFDVPTLVRIPKRHTINKSFYLLKSHPGKWNDGDLWVESSFSDSKDSVSSIIIGSNYWSSAWALNDNDEPIFPVIPNGEEQRELSYRFGINLTMYAMTGNYKSDQIHNKAILQRLGKKK